MGMSGSTSIPTIRSFEAITVKHDFTSHMCPCAEAEHMNVLIIEETAPFWK